MNILKYTLSFNKGYTKRDYGYFTNDKIRPNYYEGNVIYIEKLTKQVLDDLNNYTFVKLYAPQEFFIQHELQYDIEHTFHMKKIGNNGGIKQYKNYSIHKVDDSNFELYKTIEEYSQVHQYNEIFNPVYVEELRDDIALYVILDNNIAVATCEIMGNKVIENVFTHPNYRKQGIMNNYLNYISDGKTLMLHCDDGVVDFYKRCGFEVDRDNIEYSMLIKDYQQFVSKVRKILKNLD